MTPQEISTKLRNSFRAALRQLDEDGHDPAKIASAQIQVCAEAMGEDERQERVKAAVPFVTEMARLRKENEDLFNIVKCARMMIHPTHEGPQLVGHHSFRAELMMSCRNICDGAEAMAETETVDDGK